jgi:hypothetical protein
MYKLIDHLKNAPILRLVIYCVAIAHCLFCADAISSFGLGFTEDVHWRTWFILALTIVYIAAAITQNRFFYYTYIGLALASMLLVFAFKDYTYYCTIFRAMFPMHLLFAGILILDLQRVIFLAHRNRPNQ